MDRGFDYFYGTPIIIVPTRKIQNKSHKKKRINKKWAKRYGFTISEILKNGETYMMDGKLYMNQHTYTQLKTSIEFEKFIKKVGELDVILDILDRHSNSQTNGKNTSGKEIYS